MAYIFIPCVQVISTRLKKCRCCIKHSMRKIILPFLTAILLISCTNKRLANDADNWSNARWIALEQLHDSMLVVPGVHGSGDQLGTRGLKRSVVPIFRKDFNITETIESATIECLMQHLHFFNLVEITCTHGIKIYATG